MLFGLGAGQKHHPGLGLGGPQQSASYGGGYPGPNKKIEIPNGRVGVIIGKGGETIKYLQLQSGAKIQVTRDMDADPNSTYRAVELMGTPEQIAKAEQLINDVLSEVFCIVASPPIASFVCLLPFCSLKMFDIHTY